MNLKHFQFQLSTPKGEIDVQFNYSKTQKKIVWLHIYKPSISGFPSTLNVSYHSGEWCFTHSYNTKNRNDKMETITDVYSNNDISKEIIKEVFKKLKEDGLTDNDYFK